MIKLLTLAVITMYLYNPVRPPEPTVLFPYDPNQVTSDILFATNVRPSNTVSYIPLKVTELDGEYGMLTCNDPDFTITYVGTLVDPNDPDGVSRIHNYIASFRAGTEQRVLYSGFTFLEDPNGMVSYYVEDANGVVVHYPNGAPPQSDSRTGLIDVKKINRKPILDIR
jgi:hypothetical protein